jgi:small-conductance mechanosensitive channel
MLLCFTAVFGRATRHPGEALLKNFACLIGFIAFAAMAPTLGQAHAKPAPVQKEDRTRGETPVQKQGPAQKQPPAQGQAPTQGQPPANGQASQPMGPPAPPPPAPPPPEQAPIGPVLDKLSASLKQIEANLESHALTDADLQDLRQQIDPISAAVGDALDRLTPRLAGIKTRLDQLGPKPDDSAPPESPAVTAERADQQKLYNDTDELLKRARLIAVQADQIGANITARRRALFTRSLFARAASIANPTLWTYVWQEAPGDTAAIKGLFSEWIAGINNRFDGQRLPIFWGALALIILLYMPLARLARRVLARNPAVPEPSRFLKILGAWWIALVIVVPAIAMITIIGLVFQAFDLTNARLQPFMQASGEAVIRIAAAAGIARGLFAPTRPHWRLPKLNDRAAEGIVRVAISLACIVSVTRLFEALNDIVGASLPVAVTMRGLAAMMGAIMLAVELWRFGSTMDTDDCLGPEVAKERGWFVLFRVASWAVTFAIAVSVLIGYAAFGSFLLDQFFWVCAVASVLFMSIVLVEEAIGAGLVPTTRLGHRLITSIGFNRNSLELTGVLFAGLIRLVLLVVAVGLVLAPWGLQRSDVPIDFGAAFFGFKFGDITISPFNIFIAIGLFALAFGMFHAVLQWIDSKLFPHMNLDLGLRNSIRTSLGYLGFLIAAGLALGYLGLNFEKLALVAGALSVGIGFGLQSIVNNFVSGLILLWERVVRVGDWIVVGGDQGFVRRINVRSTEIETFDRAQVIIPNSSLVTGVVTNLVRNDRTGRVVIPLAVAAFADPEKVREVLVAIAKASQLVLTIPAPQILFTGVSASTLNFELRVFVGDVETSARVKSDLHFEIFRRFKEEKFLELPKPDPTKVEIAGFENLGNLLQPLEEFSAANQPKRGVPGR